MRLSKRIFWISVVISLITIFSSIFIEFNIEKNNIITFIVSILENIFAGTIVLTITSLFEYFSLKRDALEDILLEVNNMRNLFYKLDYFNYREYVNFEDYLNYYKEKDKFIEITKRYKISKNKYLSNQKKSFETIINQYIFIAEMNFNSFWNKYKNIDFIFDLKNKKRNKIYNDFFKYVYYDKIEKIREKAVHFKEYNNSKNGNYIVNKEFLEELQKEIFDVKEINRLESTEKYERDDFILKEKNFINGTSYIVKNKVVSHINDFYDYINNLTYRKNTKKDN